VKTRRYADELVPIALIHVPHQALEVQQLLALLSIERWPPISLVRNEGRLFLRDGHHRLILTMLQGETHIQAHVVELDQVDAR